MQIRPEKRQAWTGSKLFDTLIVFLKEFLEKDDFEKNVHVKLPSMQRVQIELLFKSVGEKSFFKNTLGIKYSRNSKIFL